MRAMGSGPDIKVPIDGTGVDSIPSAEAMTEQMSLTDMFRAAESAIERKRTDNLFKQLDERKLTEEEELIIQKRVEMQRKMFQEYEKREQKRKVSELQAIIPELKTEDAEKVLVACNWKEDEAAVRFASDSAFRRRVLGVYFPESSVHHAVTRPPVPHRPRAPTSTRRHNAVDATALANGEVFVGRFRGKLGPHQEAGYSKPRPKDEAKPAAALKRGRKRKEFQAEAAQQEEAEVSSDAEESEEPQEQQQATEEGAGQAAVPRRLRSSRRGRVSMEGVQDPLDSNGDGPATDDNHAEITDPSVDGSAQPVPECKDANMDSIPEDEPMDAAKLPVMCPVDQDEQPQVSARDTPSVVKPYKLVKVDTHGNIHEEVPTSEVKQLRKHAMQGKHPSPIKSQDTASASPLCTHRTVQHHAKAIMNLVTLDVQVRRLLDMEEDMAIKTLGAIQDMNDELAASLLGTYLEEKEKRQRQKDRRMKRMLADSSADQGMQVDGVAAGSTGRSTSDTESERLQEQVQPGRVRRAAAAAASKIVEVTLEEEEGNGKASRRQRGAACRKRAAEHGVNSEPQAAHEDSEATVSEDDDFVPAKDKPKLSPASAPSPKKRKMLSLNPGTSNSPSSKRAAKADDCTEAPASSTQQHTILEQLPGTGHAAAQDASVPAVQQEEAEAGVHRPAACGESADENAHPNTSAAALDDEETEDERPSGKSGPHKRTSIRQDYGISISAKGHTKRGRVKQKGAKKADILTVGEMVFEKGWSNAGYIFPAGFKSRVLFRSSVDLDKLCYHECEIVGSGGQYWKQKLPTFKVTALDRPEEPIVAKSCTGCWTGILRRINDVIEDRRSKGEDLPPPPKTAIAGPEYFGLNQEELVEQIEALDPEQRHRDYWAGKAQREAYIQGNMSVLPPQPSALEGAAAGRASRAGLCGVPAPGKGRGRKGKSRADDEDGGMDGDEEEAEAYAGNKWSSISRSQRYRKRCADAGEDVTGMDEDNPLPKFIDPITLEPVVNPAISPYGHVMGLATWRAVLAEQKRCPFTKNPLGPEQLTVLTKNNIERYRDRIIQQ